MGPSGRYLWSFRDTWDTVQAPQPTFASFAPLIENLRGVLEQQEHRGNVFGHRVSHCFECTYLGGLDSYPHIGRRDWERRGTTAF